MHLTRVYIRNWSGIVGEEAEEGFGLIQEAVRVLSGHSLQSLWRITDGKGIETLHFFLFLCLSAGLFQGKRAE
jgi:hypothetical protein